MKTFTMFVALLVAVAGCQRDPESFTPIGNSTTTTTGAGGAGGGSTSPCAGNMACCEKSSRCTQDGAPECGEYVWCGDEACRLHPKDRGTACGGGKGSCDGVSTECVVPKCAGDPTCCEPSPHCQQDGAVPCGNYVLCGGDTCKLAPADAGTPCSDADDQVGTCDGSSFECVVIPCEGDDTCCVKDDSHCSQTEAPACGEYLWCGNHICTMRPKDMDTPCQGGTCDGHHYECVP